MNDFVPVDMTSIGRRILTQDNQCTSFPMYVVQVKRRMYGLDTQYSDETVWLDDDGEEVSKDTPGAEETGFLDQWEFVTMFFTADACQEFIKNNSRRYGELRMFVESFHRNPEMIAVRQFLMDEAKKT